MNNIPNIRSLKETLKSFGERWLGFELGFSIPQTINSTPNTVNVKDVAGAVFTTLDSIDVNDLWKRTDPNTSGAYLCPNDVAVAMVKEALKPYCEKLSEYNQLKMREEALLYCEGTIKGIYRYEFDSTSEFKNWSQDIPVECLLYLLEEWQKATEDQSCMNKVKYFINNECPRWAK